MSEVEEKLGAILGDPNIMQQIMSMAQALNQTPQSAPHEENEPTLPNIDPGLLRSLAGFAKNSSVDTNQQSLLNALCPYMSQVRVHKLEKAMRAAKLAGLASNFLNAGGLQMLAGR